MAAIPTRKIGDIELPCIGVGCWSFGSADGEYWGEQDQAKTNSVVAAALARGPTFFDTAEAYQSGRSEEALGAAITASGKGEHAIIGGKILPQNCFKVREHLEATLKRLGTESIYLYQVHWPLNELSCKDGVPAVSETFKELAALQKEGKIKHIGVSNFGVKQLQEALDTGVTIATNQLMYNLFSRGIEFEVIPLCAKHNIGVIAYSPLLQGLLTDKGDIAKADKHRTRTRHFDGSRELSRHGGKGAEDLLVAALAKIKEIAAREGYSTSALAQAWCLSNPQVVSIIPGCRDERQLESNFAVAAKPLSEAVAKELNEATGAIKEQLGSFIDYYAPESDQRSF